jgi:glycine cleavage system H protein
VAPPAKTIYYKRARFVTHLPDGPRYTASHHWLAEEEPGLWRVGFTKFATRMLGDLVELGFEVAAGDRIEVGQTIGSIEGFKAISDLFSVAQGEFAGANPELQSDVTLVDTDPYGKGWLYRVRGEPDGASVDVHGYVAMLDATIDEMRRKQQEGGSE